MVGVPDRSWDAAETVRWLDPAFDVVTAEVARARAEENGDPRWEDLRSGFLRALDVDHPQVDTLPELRVLQLLLYHVDTELGSDAQRWELLADEARRRGVVERYHEQWRGELAEYDLPAAVDPVYVEGRGWMHWDPGAGEWIAAPADAGPAHQEAADPAADPAATYVEGHGWMHYDADAGEWVASPDRSAPADPAPPAGTPEDVSAELAELVVLPGLRSFAGTTPTVSLDRIEAVTVRLVVEHVARAAGTQATATGTGDAGSLPPTVLADLTAAIARAVADAPDPARRFAAVFPTGGTIAEQWVGYAMTARADRLAAVLPPLPDPAGPQDDEVVTATGSAADLRWVTPAQQEQLADLDPVRGGWRTWLPAELDGRWSGWRDDDPELLVPRLDAVLPMLILPEQDAQEVAELVEEITDDVVIAALDDLSAEERAALRVEDIEAELEAFFADQLTDTAD